MSINGRVISPAQPALLVNSARRAEIDTARQLPDNHDVETFDDFRLQARRAHESGKTERRAKIGEDVQPLAQGQQPRLRALVARDAIPFRTAYRAEKNSVRFSRHFQSVVRQWRAVSIIRRAANQTLL